MRSFVVISLLLSFSIARADNAAPLKAVADTKAVCAALQGGDDKVKCTSAAKSTVRDVGNVEIYVAKGGMVRYAIVVVKDGKTWMSAPLELMASNCGMQKCDELDDSKPALRTLSIGGKGVAGALIEQKYHHEHTDDSSGKGKQVIDEHWNASSVIACNATKCTMKTWGGRGNSCKVQLKSDGSTVASCETTESISVD